MSAELLRRRRSLMRGKSGPTVNVYTNTLTIAPDTTIYTWNTGVNGLRFIVGGEYKVDWSTNARGGSKIAINIQGYTGSGNKWEESGSFTTLYTSVVTPQRIVATFNSPQNGTLTLTVTETIN